MQLRQLIQPGITASVLAHGLLLGLVVLFSEVHQFSTATSQPITVDLVKPEEVPKPSDETRPGDEKPQPQIPKDDFTAPAQQAASPAQQAASPPQSAPASSSPPAAEPAKPAPEPAKQKERTAPAERQAAASAQPQPARPQAAQQPAPLPPPSMPLAPQQQPAYTPPEPDVTVKYGVMLGLPEALPPPSSADKDKPGDGTDATASSAANLSSSLIAKFREHLKSCAKLPASVARSDNVFVRLRVAMTPQAKLAAEPVLIEGSASVKALELKSSAVQALSACQPYDMLPVDRYGEWRVLDLSFTPQDFS